MSQTPSGIDEIRDSLAPELERLVDLVRYDEKPDQEQFFERIRHGVVAAREPDDLAGPFMELSTSAFMGFAFSPIVQLQLDWVLSLAQRASLTLSADAEQPH